MGDDIRHLDCDYLIVGAGTAGCVLAAKLVKQGLRVVLLEDGLTSAHKNPLVDLPGQWFKAVESGWPVANPLYTSPQKQLHGRRIPLWTGRGGGGSTNVHASLFHRGRKTDYASWPWSIDFIESGFVAVEAQLKPELHEPATVGTVYATMAEQAGHKRLADPSTGSVPWIQDGVRTVHHCSTLNGRRLTAWEAFIAPLLGSENLTVLAGTAVTRLIFDDSNRAVGVEAVTVNSAASSLLASRKGAALQLRLSAPDAEIVLCCGAVGTPKLLLLSGVGPRAQLDEFGIPLQCESPAVGANLQDHLLCAVIHASHKRITPEMTTPMNCQGYVEGTTAAGAAMQLMIADSWDLPNKAPLLGVACGPMSRSSAAPARLLRWLLTLWLKVCMLVPALRWLCRQHVGCVMCCVGVKSRGSLKLSSADPHAAPIIDPNYLSDERDWVTVKAMFDALRAMQATEEGKAWHSTELLPGALYSGAKTDADFRRFVADYTCSYFHLIGTCAMGSSSSSNGGVDAASVCDAQLAVRGVAGLRIADASIAPSIPCCPVQGMTMMIGDRAAEFILAARSSNKQ